MFIFRLKANYREYTFYKMNNKERKKVGPSLVFEWSETRMSYRPQYYRFYEKQYPEVDEICLCIVTSIEEMGVYVRLLEYGGIQGMILPSEISKRRIRSMSRIIRVGRKEVVTVLRVDTEKGYIDLSKKKVTSEDILKCEERYLKAKSVYQLLIHVCEKQDCEIEPLYENIVWPLYRRFGHAFDAFKISLIDPERVFSGLTIDPAIKECLQGIIVKKLTPTAVKIRADVEVTCFTYKGIDAIKRALLAAEALSTEEIAIECRILAAPVYTMTTTTTDQDRGIAAVNAAIQAARECLEEDDGELNIQNPPRVVSGQDDQPTNNPIEADNDDDDDDDDDDDEDSDEEEEEGSSKRAPELEEDSFYNDDSITR